MIKDQVLYKEGDRCNGIYFVKSGNVEIRCRMQCAQRVYVDECEPLRKDFKSESREVVLGHLTPGAIFGEEEVIRHGLRLYSATCSSLEGEVYVITKADLDRRLWWQDSRDALMELVLANQDWLTTRKQELQSLHQADNTPLHDDLKLI